MSAVSRETLAELAAEHRLPDAAADRFGALLDALAAEPDPHTTVSDPARAVDIHLRDSLSALGVDAVREASAIADIGAGAGFPGLPLAIALPGARVDLIESAGRKTAVIGRLAAAAGVENARAVTARAEEWAAGEGRGAYDVATARAVAPLAVLLEYAAPLLRLGGTFIAWKGAPDASEERAGDSAAAELGFERREIRPVTPFKDARELHLYLYSKVRDTPERFPRRPGMAAKRPLDAKNRTIPPLT
jgi:16S rRNA (guanine527-N7)-methyltransferase